MTSGFHSLLQQFVIQAVKPPLTKSQGIFSSHTATWYTEEETGTSGSVHPPKMVQAGINAKSTRFPFSLPPLLFYTLPSTTFQLPTKCYRGGLAAPPTRPSAALTRWCPTLPSSERLIFGGVTPSAQDNHPDSSNPMGKRHFPTHRGGFGSVEQEASAAEPPTSARQLLWSPGPCLPCQQPCSPLWLAP